MSELQAPYNLGLTKESSEEQVREYFKRVFHLYSSNEKFPVDLNDVWPLVYSEKSNAVRELRHSFREGEDYMPLAKLGQRTMDGRFAGGGTTYRLSVLCMEYLIVKKVPIVFNVYREVFKQVAISKQAQKVKTTTTEVNENNEGGSSEDNGNTPPPEGGGFGG